MLKTDLTLQGVVYRDMPIFFKESYTKEGKITERRYCTFNPVLTERMCNNVDTGAWVTERKDASGNFVVGSERALKRVVAMTM